MTRRIITQVTPSELVDLSQQLVALRKQTPSQPGEKLSAYLERAGVSDAHARDRLLLVVKVLEERKRNPVDIKLVLRFLLWRREEDGTEEIETVRIPTH